MNTMDSPMWFPPLPRTLHNFLLQRDSPYTFKGNQNGNSIVAGFRKHREEQRYLDVTLKISEVVIKAHKAFLASFSAYFDAMFNFEPLQDVFELHDIDATSLANIIDYAYGKDIEINQSNVQDLLQVAHFVDIQPVFNICFDFIMKNLTIDNCLDVMQLASQFDKTYVYNNAKRLALEHFEEISKLDELLNVSQEVLTKYLTDDNLVVTENSFLVCRSRQEELIQQVVQRYVEFDLDKRPALLPDLLSSTCRPPDRPNRDLPGLRHKTSDSIADGFLFCLAPDYKMFDDSIPIRSNSDVLYVTGLKVYIGRWEKKPVVGGIKVFYNTQESVLHGGDDYGFEEHKFRLDIGERIVSASFRSDVMVDQVTFTTNKARTFGPYGSLETESANYQLCAPKKGAYLSCFQGRVFYVNKVPFVRHLRLQWDYYHYEDDDDSSLDEGDDMDSDDGDDDDYETYGSDGDYDHEDPHDIFGDNRFNMFND